VFFGGHGVYSREKDFLNKNVFNCRLNSQRGAAVTLVGRLFQAFPCRCHTERTVTNSAMMCSQHNESSMRARARFPLYFGIKIQVLSRM